MIETYQDTLSALRIAQVRQDYIKIAAREYLSRQNRHMHPEGHFDQAGRWYPTDEERCECCELVNAPSRQYPGSLLIHCRTARHMARLCNVSEGELLAMAGTL